MAVLLVTAIYIAVTSSSNYYALEIPVTRHTNTTVPPAVEPSTAVFKLLNGDILVADSEDMKSLRENPIFRNIVPLDVVILDYYVYAMSLAYPEEKNGLLVYATTIENFDERRLYAETLKELVKARSMPRCIEARKWIEKLEIGKNVDERSLPLNVEKICLEAIAVIDTGPKYLPMARVTIRYYVYSVHANSEDIYYYIITVARIEPGAAYGYHWEIDRIRLSLQLPEQYIDTAKLMHIAPWKYIEVGVRGATIVYESPVGLNFSATLKAAKARSFINNHSASITVDLDRELYSLIWGVGRKPIEFYMAVLEVIESDACYVDVPEETSIHVALVENKPLMPDSHAVITVPVILSLHPPCQS
ncbi:hypothetical protein Pdsh_04430 [Pyrodictium delaneyi]|uniref:Uncharacterized protein n=1 Tax=Pyrodictium delaneyi TaxID=1273541 RepID=A0A211YQ35_9CREN|nr:hypothetical protein Pdsh_04430 [Pyrodictium delaneyi]